jgi:hypothetical protein
MATGARHVLVAGFDCLIHCGNSKCFLVWAGGSVESCIKSKLLRYKYAKAVKVGQREASSTR